MSTFTTETFNRSGNDYRFTDEILWRVVNRNVAELDTGCTKFFDNRHMRLLGEPVGDLCGDHFANAVNFAQLLWCRRNDRIERTKPSRQRLCCRRTEIFYAETDKQFRQRPRL